MRRDRWIPPGISLTSERKIYLSCLAVAFFVPTGIFGAHYSRARSALFFYSGPAGSKLRLIREGAMMEPLPALLHGVFDALFLVLALMGVMVVLHYLHYRRGSMSIYLMRRLPDRKLLHQQCWTLPVLYFVLYALVGLALLGCFTLIYLYMTPAQCLPMVYRRMVL